MPPDSLPPLLDLDLVAARAAEAHYRAALAAGMTEARAWAEATDVFRLHHPAWPLPLAEREAARVVGALIAWDRARDGRHHAPNHRVPPLALLHRLSRPAVAHGVGARDARQAEDVSTGRSPGAGLAAVSANPS
jgi:hypothetical protein